MMGTTVAIDDEIQERLDAIVRTDPRFTTRSQLVRWILGTFFATHDEPAESGNSTFPEHEVMA